MKKICTVFGIPVYEEKEMTPEQVLLCPIIEQRIEVVDSKLVLKRRFIKPQEFYTNVEPTGGAEQ